MRLQLSILLLVIVVECFDHDFNDWYTDSQFSLFRWKRQLRQAKPQCGVDKFRCNSGACVDQLVVCDGARNCPDGSDETAAVCKQIPCPSYAFHCTYGGCIDLASKCDGKNDCVDRSDETSPDCEMDCSVEEFECEIDGSCIDELLLCDGKRDCEDGSDEGPSRCANVSCPAYAFRCRYGGCIDAKEVCDGDSDCDDSSDEEPALCRSGIIRPTAKPSTVTARVDISTVKPTRPVAPVVSKPTRPPPTIPVTTAATSCTLPPLPLHGSFSVGGCEETDTSPLCRLIAGTRVPKSIILYNSCDPGYTMEGKEFSVCLANSSWIPPIPTCVLRTVACHPVKDISLEIACSFAGKTVDCNVPLSVGSEARIKCNEGYILAGETNYRKINCQAGGVWDRPLFTCVPDCGKRNPNGRPFISGGEVAQIGEFPWHAAIYKNTSGTPAQVCGGTLISPKIVISAAHCFWDESRSKKEEANLFRVALGKFVRDWNTEDSEAQKFEVADILPDERYRGRKRNFQFDVAIVRLAVPAEMTWAVNIACVDWDNELERFQLAVGQVGVVSGWGITEANKPSEFLKTVRLPYVELFPTCYNTVAESFQPYLTSDKFCAGVTNNRTSVCPGDSGGGLLFQHAENKRYYLRGIVSVGSKPDTNAEKCYTQAFTAFSKFSESLKWVETFMNS